MSRLGILLSGLITAVLWFAFYGQDLWMEPLGIFDIPGAEVYVLGLFVIALLGFLWPDPLASLAAGVGGLAGMLIAINVTGRYEDYFPAGVGFDSTWVQLLVVPAGAHVFGAAARRLIGSRSGAPAEAAKRPEASEAAVS